MKHYSTLLMALVCLVANAQLFQSSNQFIPNLATAVSSMDVANADLDNDGFQDIVIAAEFGRNIESRLKTSSRNLSHEDRF